jgi:NAD(P)-dependent dehydrogenase (short-subunit alcohol dehydrogenase family)
VPNEERFLEGASAAVTGGGHGIGRAIALHLGRAGAKVAVGDIDQAAAEKVATEVGENAFGQALDISDRDSFAGFLDEAEARHGPLRVMVNNAGIDWIGPFHEEPDDVTQREINVNLFGTTTGSKLALQRMLPRRSGHLVNVASGVGRVPLPGSATYSATKHGVVGLMESLRLEYRGSGVDFSVVLPSQVETGMLDGQARPRALPQVSADDVAEAVIGALESKRFEVWVPRSQGVSVKLGSMLPRAGRDLIYRALGVTKIAGDTDAAKRRDYHRRAFGRD